MVLLRGMRVLDLCGLLTPFHTPPWPGMEFEGGDGTAAGCVRFNQPGSARAKGQAGRRK